MTLFEENVLNNKIKLKNRIIRSATFEGMADKNGFPLEEYKSFYKKLSENNIGGIITGFAYINKQGSAIEPGQAGIDNFEKIKYYEEIVKEVHKNNCKIFMQIAHTGRQTRKKETGFDVLAFSKKKSFYFRSKVKVLKEEEIEGIIEEFVNSAYYAKEAGFDGVQVHSAHGYLVHQSIHPSINKRKDSFAIDKKLGIGVKFLDKIINGIRKKCGDNFIIALKISGSDDYFKKFTKKNLIDLIKFLDKKAVDFIEMSYGTMDHSLNIFRGKIPINEILNYNPIYSSKKKMIRFIYKILVFPLLSLKQIKFSLNYNLKYAKIAREHSKIPIVLVGGIRTRNDSEKILTDGFADYISFSRPFICEADFAVKLEKEKNYSSKCCNCNICAVMCDSSFSTCCYKNKRK